METITRKQMMCEYIIPTQQVVVELKQENTKKENINKEKLKRIKKNHCLSNFFELLGSEIILPNFTPPTK